MTIKDEVPGEQANGSSLHISNSQNGLAEPHAQTAPTLQSPPHQQPDVETPLAQVSLSSQHGDYEHDDERVRHWKESQYAVGLVDVTWSDSRRCNDAADETPSHLLFLAWICPLFRAKRVGNMAVLMESTHVQEMPSENGIMEPVALQRPTVVFGPFCIVATCITYPIILVVTVLAGRKVWQRHVAIIVVWAVLTLILLISLSLTSCVNPGIMARYNQMPREDWRWNDQARTFRPSNAKYDTDCAVVIEEFDHT